MADGGRLLIQTQISVSLFLWSMAFSQPSMDLSSRSGGKGFSSKQNLGSLP